MKIVIFKGKHGDTQYVAETSEQLYAAMWAELKSRKGWYEPWGDAPVPEKDRDIVLMPEEEFLALPESVQTALKPVRARYQRDVREYEEKNELAELVASVTSLPAEEAVKLELELEDGSMMPVLSYILDLTRDNEYEQWYTDKIGDPLGSLATAK